MYIFEDIPNKLLGIDRSGVIVVQVYPIRALDATVQTKITPLGIPKF